MKFGHGWIPVGGALRRPGIPDRSMSWDGVKVGSEGAKPVTIFHGGSRSWSKVGDRAWWGPLLAGCQQAEGGDFYGWVFGHGAVGHTRGGGPHWIVEERTRPFESYSAVTQNRRWKHPPFNFWGLLSSDPP
ncbi:hypothetical protein GCM10010245_50580 [Streptomyces spectabilis]|nr:hypothetical protein GCM10010245_50580 [Streptomyces spectabilis]